MLTPEIIPRVMRKTTTSRAEVFRTKMRDSFHPTKLECGFYNSPAIVLKAYCRRFFDCDISLQDSISPGLVRGIGIKYMFQPY